VICKKCGEAKPPEEFYLLARGYEWRQTTCKACHRAKMRVVKARRRRFEKGELKRRT